MSNCETRRSAQILQRRTGECSLSRPFPARFTLLDLGQRLGARSTRASNPNCSTGDKTMGREIFA